MSKHVYCETRHCALCQTSFDVNPRAQPKRRFCGKSCSAKWRMQQPEIKEIMRAAVPKAAATRTGRSRPDARARMLTNNPMLSADARDKMANSLKGRAPKVRGGNGTLTPEQIQIAQLLGWDTEVAIPTAPVKDQFEKIPTSYKVDVGNRQLQMAIEIDGGSHSTLAAKARDQKKDSVLYALGWFLLRVPKAEAVNNPQKVVDLIQSSMTSKS